MGNEKASGARASRTVPKESHSKKKGFLPSPLELGTGDGGGMSTPSRPLIKVWRMHRSGSRIAAADNKLGGAAPLSALKWCGPYVQANKTGFYLYSPMDVD